MDDTGTQDGREDVDFPELPDGWEWASGNASATHYTHWFNTKEAEDGYDGEVYWDQGNGHTVHIYPITGIRDDGDPEISEYPDESGSYDSKQEAIDAVPELIEKLD